ncbi:hypothetical protein V5799_026988 [Amblyomma americanum]|uniref:Uncharacterized protein n=1 Tax=Amblyomma americanum TaxID=6943 RepID=A0AAQ4DH04_AMBAM
MDELPLPPLDPKEPVPDATTKRTTTPAPTTSMRTTTTTTTTTTETTLPTTTGTPTASTKSPRLSMDEQPLVCTMGSRTNSVQMFPQDGLCEYLFFDSVDKDNRNPLALPNEWDIDLRVFLNAPSRYSTTAFGVGFAFEKAFSVYRQLGNTTPSLLQPFWRNDIFHFGILDTATRNPWRADVELALLVLKVCRNDSFLQASYSRSADAVLAVHESEPVLFAYDNELGLARKLCTVKAQRLSLRFGIAVYDLDYEDFSNFCGPLNKFGAFSRLHAIRSILNFYRTKFNRFADLRPCWQFVPRHALTEIE